MEDSAQGGTCCWLSQAQLQILKALMACLQRVTGANAQEGGCENAEEVLRAFRRIVVDASVGLEPDPDNLLPVRSCGRVLVENFRRKTIKVCSAGRSAACRYDKMPVYILQGLGPDMEGCDAR